MHQSAITLRECGMHCDYRVLHCSERALRYGGPHLGVRGPLISSFGVAFRNFLSGRPLLFPIIIPHLES